jgi:hypothetical protein
MLAVSGSALKNKPPALLAESIRISIQARFIVEARLPEKRKMRVLLGSNQILVRPLPAFLSATQLKMKLSRLRNFATITICK